MSPWPLHGSRSPRMCSASMSGNTGSCFQGEVIPVSGKCGPGRALHSLPDSGFSSLRYSSRFLTAPSRMAFSSQPTIDGNGASTTPLSAITTYVVPGARTTRRVASRSLRLARFRATALPTFFPATNPTSVGDVSLGVWITVIPPLWLLEPVRYTFENPDPDASERYTER